MYKLLIVDDEEIERRAIQYIIKNSNINIREMQQASNGQEAVAVASSFEPDIIIMDITMPGLNGIKAASVIKKFLPDSHIIFLTAFDEFDYAKEAVKLGADDFLVKPASPETIENTINISIKSIEKKKEQQQKSQITKDKLKGASEYLEQCLIEALIEGESNEEKINKYLSFTNIDFEYSFGSIVSLLLENADVYSKSSLGAKEQMVLYKINAEIKTKIENNITYMKANRLYVFVYSTNMIGISGRQVAFSQMMESIKTKIYDENNVVLNYGIGEVSSSAGTIWSSFVGAKEKTENRIEVKPSEALSNVMEELAQSIIEDERQTRKNKVNRAHDILSVNAESTEDYRIRLIEFWVLLKQNVAGKIHRPISVDDSLYLSTSKIKTIDDGRECLEHYANKLCQIVPLGEKDKNAIIVNRMAMYIEEHISENISLEHISEVSRLSSFYICKLFKKYLKMNFMDYVTSVRIKHAKKMLKDPYLSIKEISSMSGYADPNYFARVFKKETKLSPTIYRKQHIAKEN